MEAALQCIREKSGEIDIDADEIDAKVLDTLMITNDHFRHAMSVCNPSARRETQVRWELWELSVSCPLATSRRVWLV